MSASSVDQIPLKALILAGGRSKRLNDHIRGDNKCMLEFGGKHLIEYSLENALKMQVSEIIIVVGHLAERIINAYGNRFKGVPIRYVIQREQKGLVHAIECSREAIGKWDFVLLLGDEFFLDPDHKSLVRTFVEREAVAACGVISVEDRTLISKTYSILFDPDSQRMYRLIEKPKNPTNNLMGTGNVLFRNEIMDYVEMTPINQQRKEKELPDLIQCAIDDGKAVVHCILASTYVNVNTLEDMTVIERLTGG